MNVLTDSDSLASEKLAQVINNNFSVLIAAEFGETDAEYEQFLADVWVGIVLTLMVLSCVCCMCSCLLYHKFQQWKRSVIEARQAADLESASAGYRPELDVLPSYTVASGLPTYEEALEQLKKVKPPAAITPASPSLSPSPAPISGTNNNSNNSGACVVPASPSPTRPAIHRLSVTELFQLYRSNAPPNNNVTVVDGGGANCGAHGKSAKETDI